MSAPVRLVDRLADHLDFEAPIASVVVLEDRAMVTRKGWIPTRPGQLRLVVSPVSPLLVDKSLRASASQGRVLDIRCVRAVAPWRGGGSGPADADVAALEGAVQRARHQLELSRAAAIAAKDDLAAHHKLRRAELLDLAAAASRGEVYREAATEFALRDDEAKAAVERIAEADEQSTWRERELHDAERLAELARRSAGAEIAHLEIDCIVDSNNKDGDPGIELGIEYLVPAAAWRPFHRAELRADAIEWQQGAWIWQNSGEPWTDVELTLSAMRPSLGIEPARLLDDELEVQPKPNQVAVQSREQEIEIAGLGETGSAAPTVAGIDDGGLGLSLRPPSRCTIGSDGRPHRVALESFRSEVETALVAIPLRSPLCHVRTRFSNRAVTPILAGPVELLGEHGILGRAEIDFISAGERAELGFGSESDIRVHREQFEQPDETSLLGGWSSKTVRVVIRLSNLGLRSREVVVCDRVPVSEIEQVVITVAAPEAYLLEGERRSGDLAVPQITARSIDPHGLVTWVVPLAARGRAAVTLEYRVKSQRGVTGL